VAKTLSLPSSVQERLSGWVRIQERRMKAPAKGRRGPTITLSRQFGCEGFPLSLRLQELLNGPGGEDWQIFDKALLERVAEDAGIPMRLLAHLEDDSRILEGFGFHPNGAITHDEAFALVADTLVKIARQGHAIIVGRGGALLCRDLPNCFHFRLEADLAWRVAAISRRMDLPLEEAEKLVKVQSRKRERFIQDNLGASPSERQHYDAVFNNEHHSIEQVAAAIVAYVQSAWKGR
jgi:cytidylate kinase